MQPHHNDLSWVDALTLVLSAPFATQDVQSVVLACVALLIFSGLVANLVIVQVGAPGFLQLASWLVDLAANCQCQPDTC